MSAKTYLFNSGTNAYEPRRIYTVMQRVWYYNVVYNCMRKDSLLMWCHTKTKKYPLPDTILFMNTTIRRCFPLFFFFRRFFYMSPLVFFYSPVNLSRIDVPKNYGFDIYIYIYMLRSSTSFSTNRSLILPHLTMGPHHSFACRA